MPRGILYLSKVVGSLIASLVLAWAALPVQAGHWHLMPFAHKDASAAQAPKPVAQPSPTQSVAYRFQFHVHAYLARFYALRGNKPEALHHFRRMLHLEAPDWRGSPHYDTLCIARDREVAAIMAELGYYDYAIRVLQTALIAAKVNNDPQLSLLKGQLITLLRQYKAEPEEMPPVEPGIMKLATFQVPVTRAKQSEQHTVESETEQKANLPAVRRRRPTNRLSLPIASLWADRLRAGKHERKDKEQKRRTGTEPQKPDASEGQNRIRQISAERTQSCSHAVTSSDRAAQQIAVAGNPPPSVCLSCLAASSPRNRSVSKTVPYYPPVKPTFSFKRKLATGGFGDFNAADELDSAAEAERERAVDSDDASGLHGEHPDAGNSAPAESIRAAGSHESNREQVVQASWQARTEQTGQESAEQALSRRWLGLFKNPLRLFRSRSQDAESPLKRTPSGDRAGISRLSASWLPEWLAPGGRRESQPSSAKGIINSAPKVAIIGDVARPGLYPAKPEGLYLNELVDWAGGLTGTGRTQLTIIRVGKNVGQSAGSVGFATVYYEQLQADASELSNMLLKLQSQEIVIVGTSTSRSAFVAVMPQFVLQLPRGSRQLSAKQISALLHEVCPTSKGIQMALLTLRAVPNEKGAEQEYHELVSEPLGPADLLYIDGRALQPAQAMRAANAIAQAAGLPVRKIAGRPIPAAK